MKAAAHQYARHKANANTLLNSVRAMAIFVNAFEYKGEHCFVCGHPWVEKGELHYKNCRYYVSNYLHSSKKH